MRRTKPGKKLAFSILRETDIAQVPGTVFNDERQTENVYGRDIEVDYRGNEVSRVA